MADELRVDPESLSHAANEVANHGESLLAVHRSCHGDAAAAQPGWVGSSAGALSGLLGRWQTATTVHVGRIGQHSCDMHFAVADFMFTEDGNESALRNVGDAARAAGFPMQ